MEKPDRLLADDEKKDEEEEMDSGDGGNPQDIWGDENKFSCLEFTVFPPYRLTYGRQQKWYLYAVTKEFVERQQVGCATL